MRHWTRLWGGVKKSYPQISRLADTGYDAEWVHEFLRHDLGIHSIIPAGIGRPTARPPSGHYRRQMKQRFPKKQYGQRWQVETVFSMIKRRLWAALNAKTYWSQCRALMLKVITHNIMIICYVLWGFLQSIPVPFDFPTSDPPDPGRGRGIFAGDGLEFTEVDGEHALIGCRGQVRVSLLGVSFRRASNGAQ